MCVWCVKNKKTPQKTHTLEPTLKIGAPLPHAITLDSNTAKEKKKKKRNHTRPQRLRRTPFKPLAISRCSEWYTLASTQTDERKPVFLFTLPMLQTWKEQAALHFDAVWAWLFWTEESPLEHCAKTSNVSNEWKDPAILPHIRTQNLISMLCLTASPLWHNASSFGMGGDKQQLRT